LALSAVPFFAAGTLVSFFGLAGVAFVAPSSSSSLSSLGMGLTVDVDFFGLAAVVLRFFFGETSGTTSSPSSSTSISSASEVLGIFASMAGAFRLLAVLVGLSLALDLTGFFSALALSGSSFEPVVSNRF